MIVARRGRSAGSEGPETPDIRDELPDLGIDDFPAKRWHAVRPAFDDRSEDLLGRTAVNPLVIHQRGTHSAAPMSMAANAIERGEKLLALTDCVGVLVEAVLRGWRLAAATGMQIAH